MNVLNKKGVLTTYLLVFVIISVGLGLSLATGEDFSFTSVKGEAQIEIMNLYVLGEKDLFKSESEFKIELENAIFDLAKEGGTMNRESIEEYSYWQRGSKKCYPELDDLVSILDTKINADLEYEGETITTSQSYEKKYNLIADNATVEYTINFPLVIDYDYSLERFVDDLNFVETVFSECEKDISCWESKGLIVESVNEGNTFKIEVTSQSVPGVIEDKEIIIKGAVDFEYNPLIGGEFEC